MTSLGAQGLAGQVPLSPHRVWGDPGGCRGAGHREAPSPTMSRPASSCPASASLSLTHRRPLQPLLSSRHPRGASEQAGGCRAAAGSTGHWTTALRRARHFPLAHFTGEDVEAQFAAQGHTAAGTRTGSQSVCPGVGTLPPAPRAEVPQAWSHSAPTWHLGGCSTAAPLQPTQRLGACLKGMSPRDGPNCLPVCTQAPISHSQNPLPPAKAPALTRGIWETSPAFLGGP